MSVNIWRTIHPQTTVVPTLPASAMRLAAFWFCVAAFLLLFVAAADAARVTLENAARPTLDELYLALED